MAEDVETEIARLRARVAELERVASERMHAVYALWRERETSRQQIETELRTRAQQQAAVAELGRLALTGADVGSIMDHAAHLVAHTLGVEFCQVRELSADGTALVLKAGVGWKPGMIGHALSSSPLDSQAGFTLLSN